MATEALCGNPVAVVVVDGVEGGNSTFKEAMLRLHKLSERELATLVAVDESRQCRSSFKLKTLKMALCSIVGTFPLSV